MSVRHTRLESEWTARAAPPVRLGPPPATEASRISVGRTRPESGRPERVWEFEPPCFRHGSSGEDGGSRCSAKAVDRKAMGVRIPPPPPSVPVVQWIRTSGYEPEEWGFESLRAHHVPVVQWIGHRPPKAATAVRPRAGTPSGISVSGRPPVWGTGETGSTPRHGTNAREAHVEEPPALTREAASSRLAARTTSRHHSGRGRAPRWYRGDLGPIRQWWLHVARVAQWQSCELVPRRRAFDSFRGLHASIVQW